MKKGKVEITGDHYAQTKYDYDKVRKYALANGYEAKEMMNHNPNGPDKKNGKGLYFHLKDDVLQRKTRCHHCKELTKVNGCKAHDTECDNCGKIIYKKYVKKDIIEFAFFGDTSWNTIRLRIMHILPEDSLILCSKEIPRKQGYKLGGAGNRKAVLDYLNENKDKWKLMEKDGKEYYAFYKNLKRPNNVFDHINTHDTISGNPKKSRPGYDKNTVVQLYKGKEYSEHSSYSGMFDDFPVPQSFHLYRDWKVGKNYNQICHRAGLVSRSEYYSGRGVNRGDLNTEHLVKIHKMIKDWKGDKAAIEFIIMVEATNEMSATAFLKRLIKLDRNKYIWNTEWDEVQTKVDGIEMDKDNTLQQIATMASIFSSGPGGVMDQLASLGIRVTNNDNGIKSSFLSTIDKNN